MAAADQSEKEAAFWKKRRKNFFDFEPVALKPARPKLTKFFCFFLFTKRSLPFSPRNRPTGTVAFHSMA
jgi:hypothetical protein